MALDMDEVISRSRELSRASDDISLVRRRIEEHRDILTHMWIGADASRVLKALDDLRDELKIIDVELRDISHNMVSTGEKMLEKEKENSVEDGSD